MTGGGHLALLYAIKSPPTADETDYATFQMCGNEKIRYVHIMERPGLDENLEVGCVCTEKMSDDYEGPKRRERRSGATR